MDDDDHVARWSGLFAVPTMGWDFSEFETRVRTEGPPWSYEHAVRRAVAGVTSVLDLGTGGGEFLLRVADVLPVDTQATEGWAPNIPVAHAALGTRGIRVTEYDADRGDPLPYPDQRFDVVLCRHEAYSATEVLRVLRPGGTFLTQQVDGRNLADLAAVFGDGPAYPDVTLSQLRDEAVAAGLLVATAEEWSGSIQFADVDTLVSYLRMMPWQLPEDFTVDRYATELLDLQRTDAPLIFTERRFLLSCKASE